MLQQIVVELPKDYGADKVYIIYRRSEEQMPAEIKEITNAKDDGVEFMFQNNIVQIQGIGKVEKLELIKTELIKKEGESRLTPVNVEDSNYEIDIDYVIMALGSHVDDKISNINLENEKIFKGGDFAGNIRTVAWAARSGRDSAEEIKKYLKNIVE